MSQSSQTRPRAAFVTGAGSGIGAATARRFLAAGFSVALNYFEDSQRAAAEMIAGGATGAGQQALPVKGDVASDADCRRMVAEAVAAFGRLDVLVNAAGISKMVRHADMDGLDFEDWQRIYAVNVIGGFQMARACAPHLKAAGDAAIVNIASHAAVTGGGSSIAYAASKGAVNTMTFSLARVLAPEVRVNAVCPALVEHGFVNRLTPELFAERRARQEASAPLKKIGQPEEVAETIYFLATGASLMTGAILRLDCGLSLNAGS